MYCQIAAKLLKSVTKRVWLGVSQGNKKWQKTVPKKDRQLSLHQLTGKIRANAVRKGQREVLNLPASNKKNLLQDQICAPGQPMRMNLALPR